MQNTAEDISNAASGHKANLSNPTSKAHSKEVLESLGGDDAFYGKEDQNVSKSELPQNNIHFSTCSDIDKDPNQVAGGLKAAINNDTIPESGKDKAQSKLDNM
ncbi:MAG: hypothetical protein Q9218_005699 [Villophora microphyllina]